MRTSRLGPVDRIRMTMQACKLFERERTPMAVRAQAVWAYYHGMSFRAVAAYFNHQFSPEAVRQWWHKLSRIVEQVANHPPHTVVVVDETSIHQGKRTRYVEVPYKKGKGRNWTTRREARRIPANRVLWAAVEAESFQVVSLKLGRVQNNPDCEQFLLDISQRCGGFPILIHDRGLWYRGRCRHLALHHHELAGGVRSLIECWNRQLKHRITRFWRAFPPNASNPAIYEWVAAYSAIWNLARNW